MASPFPSTSFDILPSELQLTIAISCQEGAHDEDGTVNRLALANKILRTCLLEYEKKLYYRYNCEEGVGKEMDGERINDLELLRDPCFVAEHKFNIAYYEDREYRHSVSSRDPTTPSLDRFWIIRASLSLRVQYTPIVFRGLSLRFLDKTKEGVFEIERFAITMVEGPNDVEFQDAKNQVVETEYMLDLTDPPFASIIVTYTTKEGEYKRIDSQVSPPRGIWPDRALVKAVPL